MGDRTIARYAELLRGDFVGFAHRAYLELYPAKPFEANWHIDLIAEKLEAVRTGQINRLIVNVPPRSLKSFLGSIAFPAFVLGHDPSAEILCTSYGQDFANDLALPCRSLMQSTFYRALFNTRLLEERQAVEEFKTTTGGARRAVSWTGAMMGRGADIIIIDDPIKPEEANSEARRAAVNEAFHSSVATRLNKESGAIILIMQRLHANDLTAFVQKTEDWDVLALPALADHDETYDLKTPFGRRTVRRPEGQALQPKRQSASFLRKKREGQGARTFDAQFQQRPHGAEGAIIQRDWLVYYDDHDRPAAFTSIVQSWDTAGKDGPENSFNVCTTWGQLENRLFLLDVFRRRLNYRELKLKAIDLAREFKPTTILIEEQTLGSPLASDLSQMGLSVQTVPAGSASKIERLYARSNRFEKGQIRLPRKAPWLDTYIEELTSFPGSDFSDQVDSTSQVLNWDFASRGAENAILAMKIAAGEVRPFVGNGKKVRFQVLIGGGVVQFNDGSGRPSIPIPGAGEIIEVDEDCAPIFYQQWQKFRRIPD